MHSVAFLLGAAFAVAASTNLPVIIYSLFWKKFNARGAIAAQIVGLVSSVGLLVVGPAVFGPKGLILKDLQPLFPFINPGLISIPLGFAAGWLGTVIGGRNRESEGRFE